MFLTETDRRNLYRHSLANMRASVEKYLDKAVRHETEMRLHGGVFWRLTGRRMSFDYERIEDAVAAYGESVAQGMRDGHLMLEESRDVLVMLESFREISGRLLKSVRRAMTSGKTLASLGVDDPRSPTIVGNLMRQELEGDANVIDRLKDVTGDAFPALYSRKEFLELAGLYEDQQTVIAELADAHKRFKATMPEAMRKEQKAMLAKLKRNHARIMRMLDKAFLMFE